jgi:hypothetical protein
MEGIFMKKKIVLLCCCLCILPTFTACTKTSEQKTVINSDVSEETSATVNEETESQTEQLTETTTETLDEIKNISLGEKVITPSYEFTLNKVDLSYDVKPDNPPSYYSHYAADSGEVYIHIDADVKNTQKQNIDCDEIYSVTADYDGGYTYNGFAVAEDTDGDFTYANITALKPLQTLGIHNLIDCPEEVESSGKPLFIIITLNDDTKYKYVIR